MKAKILRELATLNFEVLAYTVNFYGCNTLDELVDKLSFAYTQEDVKRIPDDLQYSYDTREQ
ncbi:MAG: hypothetical protein IJY03_04315 [Prevotella sp.]|nr:hypothetical protein [Prevotella sp.]